MAFPFTIIDLTHPLHNAIPTWSNTPALHITTMLNHADCTTTTKFHVQTLSCELGIGTHMDAPAHCIPEGKTVSDYALKELLFPCHTVDVSARAAYANYQISYDDITAYETTYGTLQPHSFILFHTGWSRFWNEKNAYRNDLQFPTLSVEAAQLLVERSVSAVGIDTLSVDLPSAFEAHQSAHSVLLQTGIIIVENIAHGNLMPAQGAHILVAPLFLQGATEVPVRLIGFV